MGMRMSDAVIIDLDDRTVTRPASPRQRAERVVGGFLLGYRNKRTQDAYRTVLKDWLLFLDGLGVDDPIREVKRGHVDAYMRNIENRGYYATSVYRRISILATFYKYCVGEEEAERDPTINVKRPVLPRESTRTWLTRRELADLVSTAEKRGGYPYALILLLAFNGLRINEVVQADIEDMGREKHHITLKIMGKGYQPSIIALPQRTVLALEKAHDGRTYGPLLLNRAGTRMQRDAAGRIVRRVALAARIGKEVTPHSLRHSAITAYLNATDGDITGAQTFARHADLRSTQYYDRRRQRLDKAGSYVVANYAAGGD